MTITEIKQQLQNDPLFIHLIAEDQASITVLMKAATLQDGKSRRCEMTVYCDGIGPVRCYPYYY